MPDLAVTEAQVLPGENAVFSNGIAGEVIDIGETLYYEEETRRWKLADANATVQTARARAIAMSKASAAGQSLSLQTGGTVVLGAAAAPVKGTIYVQSGTGAGKMCPAADLAAGWNVTIVGIGDGQNGLQLLFDASDITV